MTEDVLRHQLAKLEQLRTLAVARAVDKEPWSPEPHQIPPDGNWYLWLLLAGRGCVSAGTRVYDPITGEHIPVEQRTEPGWVLTTNGPRLASASYLKGQALLFRVVTETGDAVVVTAQHQFLTPMGWAQLGRMKSGSVIASGSPSVCPSSVPHSMDRPADSTSGYWPYRHLGGELPLAGRGSDLALLRQQGGARSRSCSSSLALADDPAQAPSHIHGASNDGPRARNGCVQVERVQGVWGFPQPPSVSEPPLLESRELGLAPAWSEFPPRRVLGQAERRIGEYDLSAAPCSHEAQFLEHATAVQSFAESNRCDRQSGPASRRLGKPRQSDDVASLSWTRILSIEPVGEGDFYDLTVPGEEHYLAEGLWHHNSGKSSACAAYFDRFMRQNPNARGAIIAPTLGDAAESCVYGPSGLISHNPLVHMRQRAGGTHVVWPNGSEAKLFGTNSIGDVDRLRAGGNRHIIWGEEIAAWRYLKEAWENMEAGLRQGVNPRIIASTTPKTRPKLKELMQAPDTVVVHATIFDNPHIPEIQKDRLVRRYRGTRWEAQELLGQYLEDVEGAMWSFETIEACRLDPDADIPDMARVVVGVDPSGGDEDGNDEQGIVVAGQGVDGDYYVLADQSCKLSPDGWGRRAVQAYADHKADRILCESNFGGDMVISTISVAADALGIEADVKKISASRGKVARAEPIAALYEQGKVHHVGDFPELESQMRTWTPDSGWSPDRADALVWAITGLRAQPQIRMRTSVARRRLPTSGDRFSTL